MPEERISRWEHFATFLRKGPRYIGTYAGWRARRAMLRLRGRQPSWPDLPGLTTEGTTRSVLGDWSRRGEILARLPESLREATVAEADSIAGRRFRYRGKEVSLGTPLDWSHRPDGNLDWMWDLNRHHFFLKLGRAYWYTGDETHARVFAEILREWMQANPPGVDELQWRSVFEVGVRASIWCWAHALFLPASSLDEATRQEILRGLLGMGRFLDARIEVHAWNNHLLLEAKSLALLGVLHPGLPGARRWARRGLNLVERQLQRQILPDGVHSELSTMYHEIVASELLELAVVLGRTEDPELVERGRRLLETVESMAGLLRALTRPDGSRPLLGDSVAGALHVRYDVPVCIDALRKGEPLPGDDQLLEGTYWLLLAAGKPDHAREEPGPHSPAASTQWSSRAFPEGGYWILRSNEGPTPLHLVFDCGPFGDPVVPGHGHADALSLDLSVGSAHLLVDPGMYSTHLGKRWRNYFRGTSAHNTVVVDGADQTRLAGIRHSCCPARTRLLSWSTCPACDVIAAEHDGYRRLAGHPIHQRCILFRKPRYWLLLDRIRGEGRHRCELLLHLRPEHEPDVDADTLKVTVRDPAGVGLVIFPLDGRGLEMDTVKGAGDEEPVAGPVQGWFSWRSGVREAAPVVRYRKDERLPLEFATLLYPLQEEDAVLPEVRSLRVFGPMDKGSAGFAAARLHLSGEWTETVLLGIAGDAGSGAPSPGTLRRAGGLATDASVASIHTRDGHVTEGLVQQGTQLSWQDRDVAWLESTAKPGEFAFRQESGTLHVWTMGDLQARSGARILLQTGPPDRVLLDGVEIPWEHESGATVVRIPE